VTNAARGQRGRSSGFETWRRVTPPLLIECVRGHGGLSDILRGSSDAAVCADLAPLADGHLDGRDLLRRRIIDDGAPKDLTTPSSRTGCRSRRAKEQNAPVFVIEAMNGTGASPAVRIKGRQV